MIFNKIILDGDKTVDENIYEYSWEGEKMKYRLKIKIKVKFNNVLFKSKVRSFHLNLGQLTHLEVMECS